MTAPDTMSQARLAVLPDFPEEAWPSMDLVAEMLLGEESPFTTRRLCPAFRRRVLRVPWLGRRRVAFNADRLLNRHVYYPRYLRRRRGEFDLFHIADHSYAHLAHALPPQRTGVFCHDLDAFRCLLEPGRDRRPAWFRHLARQTLTGVQKAAIVFHSTGEVRREIVRLGLVNPDRLVQAPYGVAREFTSAPSHAAAAGAGGVPPHLHDRPFLLHVGSCIPRKRIDVLLDTFAAVRRHVPELRLVKVGGPWTAAQREQIGQQGLAPAVVQLLNLSRPEVAALYRGAAAVLVPSEAEGFGLPVVEALACGAPVLASDLPVLREVAGEAAVYCPVGDVSAWVEAVVGLLARPDRAPDRQVRLARAANYTWAAHARTIFAAYQRLLG